MRKTGRTILRLSAALVLLGAAVPVHAHHPTARCQQQDAQTIVCRGGFSDGGGAAGVVMDVISYDEKILISGKLDDKSTFAFKKPQGDFYVLMDAGAGHVVEIDHTEIK